MRRLNPAPKFDCKDFRTAIDNICTKEFTDPMQAIQARIYFYRRLLDMMPSEVARIFDLHPKTINEIAFKIGSNKSPQIVYHENGLMDRFPSYHRTRLIKHRTMINNRTF